MKEKVRLFNQLRDFLLLVKNKEQMENFLLGMLTPQELDEIPTRLEIVKMLKKGTPQKEISKRLGVGVATITRGSREIRKGHFKYVE